MLFTGMLSTDDLSEYEERCDPRRVYGDERHGVRRFDRCFPIRQDDLEQDQGNWK